MNVTNSNFINNILLEGLYISLWVCFLTISIYRQQILIKEINSLKKKQDILFESIQKLKIIIDIDKETEDIVSTNVAILQNKLNDIEKRIEESLEESESAEDRGVRGFPVEEDRGVRGFPVEEELIS
jgi:ribosomal protein L24